MDFLFPKLSLIILASSSTSDVKERIRKISSLSSLLGRFERSVIEYLRRYTHKIAISNQRIRKINDETVTFDYKNYRQNGLKKQMTLSREEFVRKFSLHILPKRFVKIRHYGFLSSTWKRKKLKTLQQKLGIQPKEKLPPKAFQPKYSCCIVGNLVSIATFDLRGPPRWFLEMSRSQPTHKNRFWVREIMPKREGKPPISPTKKRPF